MNQKYLLTNLNLIEWTYKLHFSFSSIKCYVDFYIYNVFEFLHSSLNHSWIISNVSQWKRKINQSLKRRKNIYNVQFLHSFISIITTSKLCNIVNLRKHAQSRKLNNNSVNWNVNLLLTKFHVIRTTKNEIRTGHCS